MLHCNKNQDYLIFKWDLIDSIKSLIANSYFQPKYIPAIKDININVIVMLLYVRFIWY